MAGKPEGKGKAAKAFEASYVSTRTVERTTTVKVHPVTEDVFAFRLTRENRILAEKGTMRVQAPADSDVQGVVDAKNLDAMLKGKQYETRNFYLADAATRERLRTVPFQFMREEGDLTLGTDFHEALSSGTMGADDVVEFDHGCELFMDVEGRFLPLAVLHDDFNGRIDPKGYDLAKLAAHLLTRPDVAVYARSDRRERVDAERLATTAEEAISAPLGFVGSRSTVRFAWQPSPEDARRMWDWCAANAHGKGRLTEDRHQAIFALDLLGARAAGCARHESYYGPADEDEKEDDDTLSM